MRAASACRGDGAENRKCGPVIRHPLTLLLDRFEAPFVNYRRPQVPTLELIDGLRDATVVVGSYIVCHK